MIKPNSIRRLRSLLATVLTAVLWLQAPVAGQRELEYEVKAAFLYNFLNFVTWPVDAFADPSDPLRICVVGPDPFGQLLDRTMQGGSVGGHPIVVERIRDGDEASRCHLVFVPRGAAARTQEVIGAAASRPVLTAGESPDFLAKGGMINFFVEGGRVRFDVSVGVASNRGLKLNARLLQVARKTVGL